MTSTADAGGNNQIKKLAGNTIEFDRSSCGHQIRKPQKFDVFLERVLHLNMGIALPSGLVIWYVLSYKYEECGMVGFSDAQFQNQSCMLNYNATYGWSRKFTTFCTLK